VDFAGLGSGNVGGVLSVVISDWDAPGIVYGKPATNCTADEIKAEVWAQLKSHMGLVMPNIDPGNCASRKRHVKSSR